MTCRPLVMLRVPCAFLPPLTSLSYPAPMLALDACFVRPSFFSGHRSYYYCQLFPLTLSRPYLGYTRLGSRQGWFFRSLLLLGENMTHFFRAVPMFFVQKELVETFERLYLAKVGYSPSAFKNVVSLTSPHVPDERRWQKALCVSAPTSGCFACKGSFFLFLFQVHCIFTRYQL